MISDLRLIEIELFSYCNRKCSWCPNSFIDRTKFLGMECNIFYNLLEELKKENYKSPITFSRYNEPMAYIDLFKTRLKQIKEILPNNKLITNTNGDFISKNNLENLPIDELTIMDYDNRGISWCAAQLINAGAIITKVKDNYIYAKLNQMQILYFVDWQKHRIITDRGGTLEQYRGEIRKSACFEPKYFIGINYDGTVSPCCNIRNDIKTLQSFIMGDLHKNTLHEILNSSKMTNFQYNCANAIFDKNSPCYTCANTGGRYTKGGGGIDYE